jgi:hypothetical protein
MERSTTPTSGLLVAPPELSPLEQEVLDEYERLAENMKKVRAASPPPLPPSLRLLHPQSTLDSALFWKSLTTDRTK